MKYYLLRLKNIYMLVFISNKNSSFLQKNSSFLQ